MRLVRLLALTALLGAAMQAAAFELTEEEAGPGTWGYRPENGATAGLNPPAFTWCPERNAEAYGMQAARDAGFEDMVYEVTETPWSAHGPSQVFPPGAYYWRFRAVDEDGTWTPWSTARRFQVPEGLPQFPKPPPEELVARVPEAHPRLFFRPEEVDHFKKLAEGDLSNYWEQVEASAEKLLKHPPDTAEPPMYTEGMVRKGAEWKRIWWGNRVYAVKAANGAATLAFAYRLTGDERYGNAARDILLALCEWDTKGSTNYRYNDEAAMPLLYYPSRAYTWAYDVFTPDERARVVEMMRERGRDCFTHLHRAPHLWRPYSSHSNRAWHWLGEVAIAFQGEFPEAEEWLDYAVTVFYTCYPVWGVADGGWHEGVAYWSSYISRFMYWVHVSQSALNIDPFDKPFFAEAGYYGLYTLPPGTRTGAFGDQTTGMKSDSIARLMLQLGKGARNPHWMWYADQHGARLSSYYGFIASARAGDVAAAAPADLPSSRVFAQTGLAVLNTNLLDGKENVQVHFKSSPFGRQSHGYNANNAFLLNLRGERVLLRTGRRDIYGSPHHKGWMFETKSDNAILVNGKGQVPHRSDAVGQITGHHLSDTLDVVVGEAGDSYEHVDRWTRRLMFFKPGILLIHDILEAPEPSTYQWLLHTPGAFQIGENTATWEGSAGHIETQFLHPPGLEITQTDQFDPPPHEWANFKLDEWHLTAATSEKAARQEFITLLVIDKAPVECSLGTPDDTGRTVELKMGDREVKVRLEDAQFHIQGAGLDVSL